jgi:SRSO17 transposase
MMTLKEVLSLGSRLTQFLRLFADCFKRNAGRSLARVYVQGLLSDIQRINCEAIALAFGRPARTLQRLLESIKWDEEKVRDRCQEIVATEHAHPEAIGIIDESGIGKSGSERPVRHGSIMATTARWRTVSSVCSWAIRRPDSAP